MDYEAALDQARRALAADPRDARLLSALALALVYAAWQDFDTWDARFAEATEIYRRLIRREPDNPAHRVNLGALYSDNGAFRWALRCYRKAEAMDWRDGNLEFNLGAALINTGERAAGLERMRRARKLPRHPDTRTAYFDYVGH